MTSSPRDDGGFRENNIELISDGEPIQCVCESEIIRKDSYPLKKNVISSWWERCKQANKV